MKPSELTALLAETIKARIAVLVTGAPGIGKSDIVTEACWNAGANLILSHPAVADPTDAKGLPWIVNGAATFLPFGELSEALTADKLTVWFLDDLGQASPAVQASYMQLLLARRVNGHVLSDNVVFIAATNRRTDRAGVSGILEPVKSRFGAIVELEPDLNEWCNWAFKPDLLCQFKASADLTNSPVPRTWSHVNKLLGLSLPPAVQSAAIAGAVGEGAATEFMAFLRLYRELPNIDAILLNPDSVDIPSNPATLYALSGALAHRTTEQNFARVARFAERMVSDSRGEFAVLLLRDAMKRCPAVVHTQAYVKLVTGELGQLVSGR
jgi:hypothetical protein